METQIYDEYANIRIVNNGNTVLIAKEHIKTIDTMHRDTVCLHMGEGPLKNIYIKDSDVIVPFGLQAEQIRDWLAGIIDAGINVSESNEQNKLLQLQQIRDLLIDIRILLEPIFTSGGGRGGGGNPR
jgi:hypothetical protein